MLGTLLTTLIWTTASARAATLTALQRAASPAEIAQAIAADSLEAELLLLGAGLTWVGVVVAVITAHLLARLRTTTRVIG